MEVFPFGSVGCTKLIDHCHVLSLTASLRLEWVEESTVPEQHVSCWLLSSHNLRAKRRVELSDTI